MTKIPYIKIYTADLLAKSRHLNAEQIGRLVIAACEKAFEGNDAHAFLDPQEQSLFSMLNDWICESEEALHDRKNSAKRAAKARWSKSKISDVCERIVRTNANASHAEMRPQRTVKCHTETDTDTETDINKLLSADQAAQPVETVDNSKPKLVPKPKRELTVIQQFSNRLLDNGFEPDIDRNDKARVGVWYRANCKYFSEILKYCHDNIDLAEACVYVCATKLEKAGLTGSYAAVVRNLPQYYAEAEKLKGVKNESS